MSSLSLEQQLLDATPPSRGSNREDFAKYAPDYAIEHILAHLRGPVHARKGFYSWLVTSPTFSFQSHLYDKKLKEEQLKILDAIIQISDFIPFARHPDVTYNQFYRFVRTTVDDMKTLWGIPYSSENIRARIATIIIRRSRHVPDTDDPMLLFKYVRDNLAEVTEAFEHIVDQKLATVPEIQNLLGTHVSLRSGSL